MTLTTRSFKGIKLPSINQYIQTLNNSLNVHIQTSNNWQTATKNLREYLNHHHYNSTVIDQESINDYVSNETKYNVHANEIFDEILTDNSDDNNLFKLMKDFKEQINKEDTKKNRFDQFKDFIIKQNRLQHRQSPEFIDNIKKQRQELKEYWQNKDKFNSYQEWKHTLSNQQETVNEIMQSLNNNQHHWEIDFERLLHEGRMMLLPRLQEFFKNLMDTIPVISKYKLVYKVNGEWHTRPLTPEVMTKLYNDLNEANFIFDIDDRPPEYFYDENKGVNNDLPSWSLFSAIRFEPNLDVKGNKDNGGSFFKYLINKSIHPYLVTYLVKLQIFDKLTNDKNNQRDGLND